MTGGQAVVAAARRRLGVHESPDGSNMGGWISEIQAQVSAELGYDYRGSPWCATAVRAWYREAGLPHEWIDPYTGSICAHAEREGWFLPGSRTAPPGALIIRCGIHVEIVEADHGTWLAGIGGNVANAVRRTVRDPSEWRIIAPPFIGAAPAPPQKITRYGFDDPRIAPVLYGGWPTKRQREGVIASLSAERRRRVRRVNIGGRSPYAFEIAPVGRAGDEWRFGPWTTREARDRVMRARERRTGRRMRPWSETYVAGGGGRPRMTSGESLT